MKSFRDFMLTLSMVLTVMVFFSGVSAFADGSHPNPQTTAEEADNANDEETMKNFVLHAKQHIEEASRVELSVLYRQMRSAGDWRHGTVYLIALRRNGNIVNHGQEDYTKKLYGDSLAEFPTVKELLGGLQGKDVDADPVCTQYGESKRWSCAVLYQPAVASGGPSVLIGGFDHDLNDDKIVRPECPDLEPEVTAADVVASQYVSEDHAKQTLENFVKEAIKRLRDARAQGTNLINSAACLGRDSWNSGPVYLFIMSKLPEGAPVVILNGNNPELTGSPFVNVLDEDGIDVGQEILDVAGEPGQGGFVRYKWDNPLITQDDVREANMSPGTSPKISYVEAVQAQLPQGSQILLIFGSGIYRPLEGDSESGGGGDDGCAIAGTGGSKSPSAAFNLFLIVFSLCCASIWKGRSKK